MSTKRVTFGDAEFVAAIESGSKPSVTVDGVTVRLIEEIGPGEILAEIDGRQAVVLFRNDRDTVEMVVDGERWEATVTDAAAARRGRAREHSMAAPMPGLVLKVLVSAGDRVSRGDPLLVLEAMKMEHQIRAPRDGRVAAVRCSAGELVQPGTDLIELEEEAS